ncbi:SET domain-containing protein SmydA-8 isoform X2 [Megalopta genalis]|uniref:SET domain-containing protein SmydA-8 isoform X2 n=1 Tax=Megalopta genalis TaxID=115081 RepID=UPI003FD198B3
MKNRNADHQGHRRDIQNNKAPQDFLVVEDEVVGRHYIATRDLAVGETIIREPPLFSGSGWTPVPICLGCNLALKEETAVPCARCSWPLCATCIDHGPECHFIATRCYGKDSIAELCYIPDTYQCMDVIRIYSMKKAKPSAYKKFMKLQSHSEQDIIKNLASNIETDIRMLFKADDLTTEEIANIMGILKINGYGIPTTEHSHLAVYELSAFIEHSCRANCSKRVTSDDYLVIRVEVPIPKGGHISVCYLNALLGTDQRRHYLKSFYFFDCACDRCQDPMEFGIMVNSIKCKTSECPGYVLPETFLGGEPNPYICKNCKSSMSHDEVTELLKSIGDDVAKIKTNGNSGCEDFLKRYKDVLHQNHFYNLDIIMTWVNKTSLEDLGRINKCVLFDWIKSCKRLNIVLRIVAPADVDLRGSLLKFICTSLSMTQLKRNFGEAKQCLDEALELLKCE